MASTFEKFSDDELAPKNASSLRRLLRRFGMFDNALLNSKIVLTSGKNALTITEGNATLELDIKAALAQAVADLKPFELVDASDQDGLKVRVVKSLLANQPPSGFSALDDPHYILDVSGTGVIYACLTFNKSTGAFTSRTVGFQEGADAPESDPDSGTYYTQIGTVYAPGDGTLECANDQFGPIKAATYRKWFAYPKEYGFAWT